jgi:membrane fusion protein (multidrug efflux system)
VIGRVTALLVDEGEAVAAGAVVLEIDTERRQLDLDSARSRLTEAEAQLAEAERQLRRTRELKRSEFASDAQMEQAQTAAAAAKSRAAAARAAAGLAERAMRDSRVAAPFAGRIARRHVSPGEFVNVGQKLFELVALDPIEVEFHLPEIDSARVAVGQVARVHVTPYPGEAFEARVTVVSPTLDPRTRTLRVQAQLPNADGRLRPGLFARIDLGLAKRQGVLMVPEEAVLQRAEGPVVFRLDGEGRVERRAVKTGLFRDGVVEIVEGIAPGDQIVTRGHADLVDGSAVIARNADGSELVRPVASGKREPEPRP